MSIVSPNEEGSGGRQCVVMLGHPGRCQCELSALVDTLLPPEPVIVSKLYAAAMDRCRSDAEA